MIRLVLISARPELTKQVDAPLGSRLLDACDDAEADIPFLCRGTSCGICTVEVLEGEELLARASPREQEVLGGFGLSAPTIRLACTARLGRAPGTVKLRSMAVSLADFLESQ